MMMLIILLITLVAQLRLHYLAQQWLRQKRYHKLDMPN